MCHTDHEEIMHGTSEWAQPSGRAITVTLWPRTGVPIVRDQRPYQSRSLEPRSQPLRERPQTDTQSRSLLESFFESLRPTRSFRTLRSLQPSRCFRSLGPVSPNGAFHTDRSLRLVTLHRLRGPLLQVPRHTDRRFRLVGRPAETEPHLRQQPRLSTAKIVDFGPKTRNSAGRPTKCSAIK